jgi:hypothetical protein
MKLEKLHNEELHGLYSSANNTSMKKSRRKKWADFLVGILEKINEWRVWWENTWEGGHSVDLGVERMITLKLSFKK